MSTSLRIPKIEVVRDKDAPIPGQLINPGAFNRYFPVEIGQRVVYLDGRYDLPPQEGDGADAERERQERIWKRFQADGGAQLTDTEVGPSPVREAGKVASAIEERLGNCSSARYFEEVLSEYYREAMDVVIIAVGVGRFDGYNYREIGYLSGRGS